MRAHEDCIIVAMLLWLCMSAAADPIVLEDFESLDGWSVMRKPATLGPAGTAAVGKGAIKVTMPGIVFRQFSKGPRRDAAAWDAYQGISFWVKGDGSDLFGCLSVAYDRHQWSNYSFVYFFSLKEEVRVLEC